jgi:preprotein translocase subunit SecA
MLKNLVQDRLTLTKYASQVRQINELGKALKTCSDLDLRKKTVDLKKKIFNANDKTIVTNESFALVREASDRVLGLRHFDVQLIGGLVLTEGKISEMKTGEGKTLVALLPTYLNALYGKGAHVITVNNYLARRDFETMGRVYRFLGLTVGLIQENMSPEERKLNYNCDVVYVTNNELGFDYLRDNMAYTSEDVVQRPFFFCVIDEVDSVLIDEARVPLILSIAFDVPTEKYSQASKLATNLRRDIHYSVDEKQQNIAITEDGVSFCEQAIGVVDLYNSNEPWISYILNSLRAKELMKRNKHYIVNEDNEVVIVDEFTGRTMIGRRWGDGVHQAVEAKEDVPIQNATKTLASISYQNLFLLYETLSGMTGTAKTEEPELETIYNLNVVPIPTNKTIKRKDFSDFMYKNEYIKWLAIAQECIDMYNIGRPVLVGTPTIEKSELLAALLTEYQIPYRLLNARPENIESESEVIAQAGCKKSVTIATNMAGRGTDILLGGNAAFLTEANIRELFETNNKQFTELLDGKSKTKLKETYKDFLKQPLADLEKNQDSLTKEYVEIYKMLLNQNKRITQKEGEEIKSVGGLHVIGTERHESRRIDNQLRGRAGRQGDPGSSRFFICLEDKLILFLGGIEY